MNNINIAMSSMTSLCNQIFSDENVEVAKSVVARIYYAEAAREQRRRQLRHVGRQASGSSLNQLPSAVGGGVRDSSTHSTHSTHSSIDDTTSIASSSGISSANSISSSTASVASTSRGYDKPLYDVFLGGSCGNTVWRRQLVIPFLKKKGITYYDPQRTVWSENMIYEESIAKENSSLFLFVLDPATVNATSFLEIAYFAARKRGPSSPRLLVVFLGKTEWRERAHPDDISDRLHTCHVLDRILAAHNVPMLHTIDEALEYMEEAVIGGKKWTEAMAHPRQRVTYLHLRTRKAFNSAGAGARSAWSKVRGSAVRLLSAASMADVAVVVACHLALPHINLVFVLVPLIALNCLIFGTAAVYARVRARYGNRRVCAMPPVPSGPLPRLADVTAPLLPQATTPTSKPTSAQRVRALQAASDAAAAQPLPAVPLSFHSHHHTRPKQRLSVNSRRKVQEISNISHDVFLACSTDSVLDWVEESAAPFLRRHGLSFNSILAEQDVNADMRMAILQEGSNHYKQLLYYIPSTKSFLSGMLEIAYLLGHANWEVTICVPKDAEQLDIPDKEEDEQMRNARRRRNDCYSIAFCYLQDMAKRKQSRVFHSLPDALAHIKRQVERGL